MLYPKRYWNMFRARVLNEPLFIPSCNDCIYISITEDEQESLESIGRIAPAHRCPCYDNVILKHETNNLIHNTYIHPCQKCKDDGYKYFKER